MPELRLTPAEKIRQDVDRFRPMKDAPLPRDLARRLGATHYAGLYHRTDQPFLLEGVDTLHKLGLGTIKLWLTTRPIGYTYNSQWNLPRNARLVHVLQHDYFRKALESDFSTFIFEVEGVQGPHPKNGKPMKPEDFAAETEQFEEVTAYLLKTFGHRRVTFILQHWEGDWILRGNDKERWKPGQFPADVQARCDTFAAWLAARQKGVERARKNAGATPATVLHAAEVNRVLDCQKSVPTLVKDVLPHVAVDLVSWSAYDGTNSKDPAVTTWHGIELIRHYARPSPAGVRNHIYIGEVGIPEAGRTVEEITRFWDTSLAVFLAHELPWIVQWELYCNEPKSGPRNHTRVYKADELRGFWLVKPDGALSVTGEFLTRLLRKATSSS